MNNIEHLLFFKFLICLLLSITVSAYKEIQAYRLIQYEKNDFKFGSQHASLSYIGSHYKKDVSRKISLIKFKELLSITDLDGYIKSNANAFLIILPKKDEITSDIKYLITEMHNFLSEKDNLIEPIYFTHDNDEVTEIYQQLESTNVLSSSLNNDNDNSLISGFFNIQNNLLQFSLNNSEPKKQEVLYFENFYGYLEGSSSLTGVTNPVIAIVANYDDLNLAIDMPSGMNSNASGLISVIEIMKILSKYYQEYDSNVTYDIMFLLTSAGNLNHKGGDYFLNNLNSAALENIHFALCLDSISVYNNLLNDNESKDKLYLHVNENINDNNNLSVKKFFKMLNSTAKDYNIDIEYIVTQEEDNLRQVYSIKKNMKEDNNYNINEEESLDLDDEDLTKEEKEKKKIDKIIKEQQKQQDLINQNANILNQQQNTNINKEDVPSKYTPWEHQNFYRKSIFGATLSNNKAKNTLKDLTKINNNNILIDSSLSIIDSEIDFDILKRNIKLVSEALVKFLFNIDKSKLFNEEDNLNKPDNNKQNKNTNDSIVDDLNIKSLVSFLKKVSRNPLNITKGSMFNNELYNIIVNYLIKCQRQSFEFKEVQFYDSNSGKIRVNNVKSKMIDLYILLAVVIYLVGLYIVFKGPTNIIRDF